MDIMTIKQCTFCPRWIASSCALEGRDTDFLLVDLFTVARRASWRMVSVEAELFREALSAASGDRWMPTGGGKRPKVGQGERRMVGRQERAKLM